VKSHADFYPGLMGFYRRKPAAWPWFGTLAWLGFFLKRWLAGWR
jgi:hypothetical protein